ncbi:protein of unknown function [Georgfuchsia toluolica]|uniref:Uncharacterized protein n=1 Tax=Georgfuchsia toluolica TaxID=424218 RepID=A0A916N9Z0_9PROT|nr:protein of unknown function [Georgfuchsia toluolica]
MARQIVLRLRKNHGPGQCRVGGPSPQFAIDEIADAPGKQAERHQRRDEIGHLPEGLAALSGEQEHGDQHAKKAAMKTHAALPDGDDISGIIEVITGIVEQHLPQTAADHHAEHAIEQQVVHVLCGEAALGKTPRARVAQPQKRQKPGQVHQAVPADCQRAEVDGNRVELGMDEHVKDRVGRCDGLELAFYRAALNALRITPEIRRRPPCPTIVPKLPPTAATWPVRVRCGAPPA